MISLDQLIAKTEIQLIRNTKSMREVHQEIKLEIHISTIHAMGKTTYMNRGSRMSSKMYTTTIEDQPVRISITTLITTGNTTLIMIILLQISEEETVWKKGTPTKELIKVH